VFISEIGIDEFKEIDEALNSLNPLFNLGPEETNSIQEAAEKAKRAITALHHINSQKEDIFDLPSEKAIEDIGMHA